MLFPSRILLVDDDDDDCYLFQNAVTSISADVNLQIARHGIEALGLLEKDKPLPDAIFMDVNMPLMNGLECLLAIKQHPIWRSIPVFMISTCAEGEASKTALATGAKAYIKKPSSFNSLIDIVTYHLHQVSAFQPTNV